MSATKYQVMYRYTNPMSNVLITNDSEEPYTDTIDIYTNEHKMCIGTDEEKISAEYEKQDTIINNNTAECIKNSMLFAFDGVKRVNHNRWVASKIGYVIRDYSGIRDKIGSAGDYSKEYVLVGGTTPESATVVAKTNPVQKTITVTSGINNADGKFGNIYYYTQEHLQSLITNATIARLNTIDITEHLAKGKTAYTSNGEIIYIYSEDSIVLGEQTAKTIKNMGIYTRNGDGRYYLHGSGLATEETLYTTATINANQVQTEEIPAHNEEVSAPPYVVKDTYRRIEQSPWFTYCVCGSLDGALERAKKLVNAIGIENVKVIKEVELDQFVKIK